MKAGVAGLVLEREDGDAGERERERVMAAAARGAAAAAAMIGAVLVLECGFVVEEVGARPLSRWSVQKIC